MRIYNHKMRPFFIFLAMSGFILPGCSIYDGVTAGWAMHRDQALAAQHREPQPAVRTLPVLGNQFFISRQENFVLDHPARLAIAYEPLEDYALLPSTHHQNPWEVEQRVGAAAVHSFKRYFANVVSLEVQDLENAEIEARMRGADYLAFMRMTQWQDRNLVKEARCTEAVDVDEPSHQNDGVEESAEQQSLIPQSPRGLPLSVKLPSCHVDLDFPVDRASLSFWWLHLPSGKMIDSGQVLGRSGWFNFWDEKPDTLLRHALDALAASYSGVVL